MQNILNELTQCLQQDERLVIDGRLVKNKIVELALALDESLIKLLLKNASIKKHFFREVGGVLVFDKGDFQKFVSNKQFLPDSYTAFKNKIGLTANGEYLTEAKEVVLAWPYKDCVLEGGQTKDDQKRKEIFWNTTLAPDEIDRLLSPKVLTNFKRYDKKGEGNANKISFGNNLLIKGNNLLALHCLKKSYKGKIDLIYTDPPYNTSGAANTFAYNNSFNHSTWLTFIKNRLEIAKSLLKETGIISIAIDHFELFYLGALMDEIFGRENRMGVIAVVHNPGGRQDDHFFPTAHENMLFYAKNIQFAQLNTLGASDEKLSQFKFSDSFGNYKLRGFRRSGSNSRKIDRPGLYYAIYYNPKSKSISLKRMNESDIEIFPMDEKGIERCWRWGPNTLMEKYEKYIEIKKTKNGYDIYTKERKSDYQGEKAKTIWNKSYYTGQTGTHELKSAFGKKVFSYPKSPFLIRDILQIASNPGDIVLDFFGGSGTTAAVALEMQRQFIIIEQMDYAEPVIKERLIKIIHGEKSGISESVGWKGGGSFLYAELKMENAEFSDKIEAARNTKELEKIWEQMQQTGFISYRINPKTINENKDTFGQLTLEEQKQFLIELLDKNQLYVNYSEIDDKDFNVSEEDKKLNRQFYKEK